MLPLWKPSQTQIESTRLHEFRLQAETRWNRKLPAYTQLHQWSVNCPEEFWLSVWDYSGILASAQGQVVVQDRAKMPGASWFPDARLNFAENLLRRRDKSEALVFWGEDQVKRNLSYAELYSQVAKTAKALRSAGVIKGDRVAAFMPNMPETIIAMLATASIGAIWSSCSPDFGIQGVIDRFGQIEPKILIGCDGYFYNGKSHSTIEKLTNIRLGLPSLEKLILVSYIGHSDYEDDWENLVGWKDFIGSEAEAEINFEQLPFDHPLYVMYSSGTTGIPKCIVHGAGGTLIQHLKEHQLHTDLRAGDRLFYFTTCGWMMWNWLVTALASEVTLLLYDGSPFYPDGNVLFEFAEQENMQVFGTSAKFIDAVNKAGIQPGEKYDLSKVRTLLSTGSPLVPESFDFVYQHIKEDICLSSISGGTDIVSCFALGNPILPVWRGELQCLGLGMDVEVWNDEGEPIFEAKGELVCKSSFPSMPIEFWNDPNGEKYRSAYFEKYSNIWCHGDYVELTKHQGMVIYGRSDAVLNPGGVRIGTAEIYRQVEQLDEVVESLVIGQKWQDDERVVLFVRLHEGLALDDDLISRVKLQIRANTTPRHVPARIVQVTAIPRTKSGKIVELAVRKVVHGEAVDNMEALANPSALDQFKNRAELSD